MGKLCDELGFPQFFQLKDTSGLHVILKLTLVQGNQIKISRLHLNVVGIFCNFILKFLNLILFLKIVIDDYNFEV